MRHRKHTPRPVTAQLRKLFDESVERGRGLDAPFSNFLVNPDYTLMTKLLHCADRMPDETSDAIVVLRGSDYGTGARELRRWLAAQQARNVAA